MFRVRHDLCRGCGVCVDGCPAGAITLKGDKAFINTSLCTECGACESVCPMGAIVNTTTLGMGELRGKLNEVRRRIQEMSRRLKKLESFGIK